MPLSVQTKAPDFTLASTSGEDFTLSAHSKPLVLYFYPKDFTSVCTAEACDFRDNIAQFSDLDITVIGISKDNVETHLRFKKEHQLPFELLADTQGKIAKLYKAQVPLLGVTRRITYLLDAQQTILAVYENMFTAKKHIQTMLEKAKTKFNEEKI